MKKNILKGVLLWAIVLSVTLFIITIDSLSLVSILLWITVNIILIIVGRYNLTLRDIYYLSGSRFIDKVLK